MYQYHMGVLWSKLKAYIHSLLSNCSTNFFPRVFSEKSVTRPGEEPLNMLFEDPKLKEYLNTKASKDNGVDGILIFESTDLNIFASSDFDQANAEKGKNVDSEMVLEYLQNIRAAKENSSLIKLLGETGDFKSDLSVFDEGVWSISLIKTEIRGYYIVAWGYRNSDKTIGFVKSNHNATINAALQKIATFIDEYESST